MVVYGCVPVVPIITGIMSKFMIHIFFNSHEEPGISLSFSGFCVNSCRLWHSKVSNNRLGFLHNLYQNVQSSCFFYREAKLTAYFSKDSFTNPIMPMIILFLWNLGIFSKYICIYVSHQLCTCSAFAFCLWSVLTFFMSTHLVKIWMTAFLFRETIFTQVQISCLLIVSVYQTVTDHQFFFFF